MEKIKEKKQTASYYSGHRERLRRRFYASSDACSDYELLELLLFYAIPRKDVKPLAKELISHFGSLYGVMNASPEELSDAGAGKSASFLIPLIRQIEARSVEAKIRKKKSISNSDDVIEFASKKLAHLKDEAFMILYLTPNNRVISHEIINEGTVDKAVVYPRNIIRNALKRNASGIILVHNHPSGECRPSQADIKLTKQIIQSAMTMDIRVLDHVIIGGRDSFSFAEQHLL
jgi:DNA repair protein RadC